MPKQSRGMPLLRNDVAPRRIGFQLAAELEQDT